MPVHLSLYLDALRVLAALTVFLGHFAQGWLGGGLFWQATPFGHTAVLVFFVLSGYVIAFAADTKEHTLPDYTIARLSRILSVSVPAVLLAAVLLLAGTALNPEHYAELAKRGQSFTQTSLLGQFLAGLTFLGESWGLHIRVFGNTPFWSLAYEFWYYIIFGCLFYLRGNARIIATLAACLVAGPKILLMAPLWAAGALAWHWRGKLPPKAAWPLAIASAAAFLFLASSHGQTLATSFHGVWWPMEFRSTDHLLGLAIALHFAAVAAIPTGSFTIPAWLANAVQNCAGYTFSIYLFHFPVLVFLGAVLPGAPGDHTRQALLFATSTLAIFALAQISEKRRSALKRLLRRA